jgi:hypothetical protein
VPDPLNPGAQLLAVARTTSDLLPYLVLLGLGFLIAAWGQSARFKVAIVIGILMILAAAGGFVLGNDSGGAGIPGLD